MLQFLQKNLISSQNESKIVYLERSYALQRTLIFSSVDTLAIGYSCPSSTINDYIFLVYQRILRTIKEIQNLMIIVIALQKNKKDVKYFFELLFIVKFHIGPIGNIWFWSSLSIHLLLIQSIFLAPHLLILLKKLKCPVNYT